MLGNISWTGFMDPLVVTVRDFIYGVPEPIDQQAMFYQNRPEGPDYLPPFSISNVNFCTGTATSIPDEEPFNFWIAIIDEIKSYTDELTKDRSLFLTYDFGNYETFGEVLSDA